MVRDLESRDPDIRKDLGPEGVSAASRPLNVFVCVPQFSSPALARGGLALAVRAQVERLARRHRVTVIAPLCRYLPLGRYAAKRREVPPGPPLESERVENGNSADGAGDGTFLILRPRYLHLPLLWRILDPLGVVLGLLGAAARLGRPDVLHAHWLYPYGLAAAIVGKLIHRPVVITAHDDVTRLGLPGSAYFRRSMRVAVRHTAAVICVSRAMADRLTELGAPPERVVVIPNGVDLADFRARDRAACRGELAAAGALPFSLHPPSKLLIFAGHLVPVKQVDRLLHAFQVILTGQAPESPLLGLVIAGGGPEQARLHALAGELGIAARVVFAGRRPHAEIPTWLAAADLLVLPSSSEGMPLVVLESLAAGTPVVASRVGGVPECLVDGASGILVAPTGVESLAAGLRTALGRDWDRDSLTAAARPFGWDAIVARVEACYVAVMAPARPSKRMLPNPVARRCAGSGRRTTQP